jgi:hypothetical protein
MTAGQRQVASRYIAACQHKSSMPKQPACDNFDILLSAQEYTLLTQD